MKCLIDLDGVLADFVSATCMLHGKPNPYHDENNHGIWDMAKLMGIPDNVFYSDMGYDFWHNLPKMPDADAIIEIIESLFPKARIGIATAPIRRPDCVTGKVTWVQKHFKDYAKRMAIGSQKEFWATEKTVLIDDRDENIDRFIEAGGAAILLPRPWNRNHRLHTTGYLEESLNALLNAT